MANSITGKITFISQILNVETKNGTFQKREVWIAPFYFDRDTGEPTASDSSQSVCVEFVRDNCTKVDQFKLADDVIIPFRIRGYVYTKDNISKCINTIEGIGINAYQKGAQIVVNEAPQNTQQPASQLQPQMMPQQVQQIAQQPVPQPQEEGGLPF